MGICCEVLNREPFEYGVWIPGNEVTPLSPTPSDQSDDEVEKQIDEKAVYAEKVSFNLLRVCLLQIYLYRLRKLLPKQNLKNIQ